VEPSVATVANFIFVAAFIDTVNDKISISIIDIRMHPPSSD